MQVRYPLAHGTGLSARRPAQTQRRLSDGGSQRTNTVSCPHAARRSPIGAWSMTRRHPRRTYHRGQTVETHSCAWRDLPRGLTIYYTEKFCLV